MSHYVPSMVEELYGNGYEVSSALLIFLPSQSLVLSSPALTKRGKLQGPWRGGEVAGVRSETRTLGRRAACCWIWFLLAALR